MDELNTTKLVIYCFFPNLSLLFLNLIHITEGGPTCVLHFFPNAVNCKMMFSIKRGINLCHYYQHYRAKITRRLTRNKMLELLSYTGSIQHLHNPKTYNYEYKNMSHTGEIRSKCLSAATKSGCFFTIFHFSWGKKKK